MGPYNNDKCSLCKSRIQSELDRLGLHYRELGPDEKFKGAFTSEEREKINVSLRKYGLELIGSHKNVIIDKIKKIILELVYNSDEQYKTNLSTYISNKLNYAYTYLANIFSENEGVSIEKFYITQKIERVKEMLLIEQLNLTEIAYTLNYSSVAHLSNQFKKITGLTPSQFKEMKRKSLFLSQENSKNESLVSNYA
ncbi:MAG TPA: AraC family transcriptional regulator [Bacteroidales bacterium]|nr:AraC family transcriptional regulator [Bacteroidales bacterium]